MQEQVMGIKPPSHWEARKLKHVLQLRRGNRNEGMAEQNLLSLSYGRIVRKDIHNMEGLVPASYEGYQIVEPGDIVLRLTDLQNDKRSLRQGLVQERGIVTSAYDAVRCSRNQVAEYWYFYLYALDLSKYYYSLGGGVRQSISFNDFPNDWLATPPEDEQRQIATNIQRSLAACDAIIKLIGGNRSAQVAEAGSLLHALLRRKGAIIVQSVTLASTEMCTSAKILHEIQEEASRLGANIDAEEDETEADAA